MIIKLGDYNICKFSPEEERTPSQSSFRTSAHFRAPELLVRRVDGRAYYSTSSDVWALGTLIFNLWTKEVFVSDDQLKSDELDDVIVEKVKIVGEESVEEFL